MVLGLPIYQFEIKIPSLAFIEIEVKDVSFGDLGIFCCPITMIKEKGKANLNPRLSKVDTAISAKSDSLRVRGFLIFASGKKFYCLDIPYLSI